MTELSHTCSSILNYFREIDIKSFKCAKVARKLENPWNLETLNKIWSTYCDNWSGAILHPVFCTWFTKKNHFLHIKGLHVKGLHFLKLYSFSFIFFKTGSKWSAWLFITRGWISQNSKRFSDIMTTCVPKNMFC